MEKAMCEREHEILAWAWSPERMEEALEHLAECESCRAAYEAEVDMGHRARGLMGGRAPDAATRGLAQAVFARTTRRELYERRPMPRFVVALAGVSLALAVAVPLYFNAEKFPAVAKFFGLKPQRTTAIAAADVDLAGVDLELLANLDMAERLEILENLDAIEAMSGNGRNGGSR